MREAQTILDAYHALPVDYLNWVLAFGRAIQSYESIVNHPKRQRWFVGKQEPILRPTDFVACLQELQAKNELLDLRACFVEHARQAGVNESDPDLQDLLSHIQDLQNHSPEVLKRLFANQQIFAPRERSYEAPSGNRPDNPSDTQLVEAENAPALVPAALPQSELTSVPAEPKATLAEVSDANRSEKPAQSDALAAPLAPPPAVGAPPKKKDPLLDYLISQGSELQGVVTTVAGQWQLLSQTAQQASTTIEYLRQTLEGYSQQLQQLHETYVPARELKEVIAHYETVRWNYKTDLDKTAQQIIALIDRYTRIWSYKGSTPPAEQDFPQLPATGESARDERKAWVAVSQALLLQSLLGVLREVCKLEPVEMIIRRPFLPEHEAFMDTSDSITNHDEHLQGCVAQVIKWGYKHLDGKLYRRGEVIVFRYAPLTNPSEDTEGRAQPESDPANQAQTE